MSVKPRTKIVVFSPFPVYPPISGGQGRSFHLYKYVAQTFDVIILCLADRRSYKSIAPGLQQITIPKSPSHCQMELAVCRETGFFTCAITPQAVSLTPEYTHVACEQAKNAEVIILSHPYLYKVAQQVGFSGILVYDAHNVEYDLHRQILPPNLSQLLNDVRQAEQTACELSQIIAACSPDDSRRLASLYNIPADKFTIIPNGADTTLLPYVAYEQRQLNKAAQKINHPLAIYMGSNFPPNLKAAKQVLKLAVQLPEVMFWLIGSVCEAFTNHSVPDNVTLLGVITPQKQRQLLSLADVALNPVCSGSGTNLKMLEYMAAGVPVVTTTVGARGINQDDGRYFRICKDKDMPACILEVLNNPALSADIAKRAYTLTKARFNWKRIAARLTRSLSTALQAQSPP